MRTSTITASAPAASIAFALIPFIKLLASAMIGAFVGFASYHWYFGTWSGWIPVFFLGAWIVIATWREE
jgi:hypothetical protein